MERHFIDLVIAHGNILDQINSSDNPAETLIGYAMKLRQEIDECQVLDEYSDSSESDLSESDSDEEFEQMVALSVAVATDTDRGISLAAHPLVCLQDESTAVDCNICLDVVNPAEVVVDIGCGHFFHRRCLDVWIFEKPNCPNCRKMIEVVSKNKILKN